LALLIALLVGVLSYPYIRPRPSGRQLAYFLGAGVVVAPAAALGCWVGVLVSLGRPLPLRVIELEASALVIASCTAISIMSLSNRPAWLSLDGSIAARGRLAVAIVGLGAVTVVVTVVPDAPRLLVVPILGWLAIRWREGGASLGASVVCVEVVGALAWEIGNFAVPLGVSELMGVASGLTVVTVGTITVGFISARRVEADEAAERDRLALARSLSESHRNNQLLSNLPGVAYRSTATDDWSALFISEGSQDLFGYTPQDFYEGTTSLATMVDDRDLPQVIGSPEYSWRSGELYQHVYRVHHRSGVTRWVSETGRVVGVQGSRVLEGFIVDVTESRRVEMQAQANASILARALEGEEVGPMVAEACKTFAEDWAIQSLTLTLVENEAENHTLASVVNESVPCQTTDIWNFSQTVSMGKGGSDLVVVAAATEEPANELRDAVHRLVQLVALLESHRKVRADLEYSAMHDWLGIANRRFAREAVARLLARCEAGLGHGVVLAIDPVGFRHINASFGFASGDALLIAIRDRIQQVAGVELVARTGGAAFVAVAEMQRCDEDLQMRLAMEVKSVVETPFLVGQQTVRLGARIGYAACDAYDDGQRGPDPGEVNLLNEAQLASAYARRGSDLPVRFKVELRDAAERRARLTHRLLQALESGAIEVHYQPEIDLETGRLFGVEALARWTDDGQLISPGEFIPIAEEIGSIVPLGAHVMKLALADAAGLDLTVSINVSPLQLLDAHFVQNVAAAIDESGVSPARVCLELTESALREIDATRTVLLQLKELGLSIAIDDFGTGYSSLSELSRFPFDFLKIDRSFVSRLGIDGADDAVVRTMFSLASSLDVQVIAEGVETQNQESMLHAMGCRLAQGFLYSRAVSRQELPRMYRVWSP